MNRRLESAIVRQTWEIKKDSWQARVYAYWRANWGVNQKGFTRESWYRQEQYCHYWRVVLLWGPLIYLLTKQWHWSLRPITIVGYAVSAWATMEYVTNEKIVSWLGALSLFVWLAGSVAGMGYLYKIIDKDVSVPLYQEKRLDRYLWSPAFYLASTVIVPVIVVFAGGMALLFLVQQPVQKTYQWLFDHTISPVGRVVIKIGNPAWPWFKRFHRWLNQRLGVSLLMLSLILVLTIPEASYPRWLPVVLYLVWRIVLVVARRTGFSLWLSDWFDNWLATIAEREYNKENKPPQLDKESIRRWQMPEWVRFFWLWLLAQKAKICPFVD